MRSPRSSILGRIVTLSGLALALIGGTRVAAAQDVLRGAGSETGRAGGTTTINVDVPHGTEVMDPRGLHNEMGRVTLPLEEPIDPKLYRCGPGDRFELNFWGRQNYSLPVTVDPEGRIFLVKVGYLDVAGKSLEEVRQVAASRIKRYYPGVSFDLRLLVPRRFLVHIAGHIERPGLYEVSATERVATVLARAGRLIGSQRAIEVRHKDGSQTRADLVRYALSGSIEHNPMVQDGDVIRVPPPAMTVSVSGAVHRPGRYELVETRDLAELIDVAGGLEPVATRELPVRVLRQGRGKDAKELEIKLGETGVPAHPLESGDDVIVPSVAELQASIQIAGALAGSGREDTAFKQLPFVKGETARSAILRAGGLSATADLDGAYIRHEDGRRVPLDLYAIFIKKDYRQDRKLEAGDTIVIPERRLAVNVEGAVLRPGPYPFNPRFDAREYLRRAGGTTPMAQDLDAARVLRASGDTLKLSEVGEVEPGDTILVPLRTYSPTEVAQLVLSGASLLVSVIAVTLAATR